MTNSPLAIARLRNGDVVRVDAVAGVVDVMAKDLVARPAATPDLTAHQSGMERAPFGGFRLSVGAADVGASVVG